MTRAKQGTTNQAPTIVVRCAIYTRKSTEEGLEQEFNSLDAQREAGEAYIKAQASEGWKCLPDRYDDGGFTGGNMDRPALKRLLGDIEAGKVDCVVVYKVDRLSRSLLDFAKMVETFEKYKTSFVSVTQQFNTSTSMGRLILHVLLSFAQFERELISERTRDKMAAARRKGKRIGGQPLLGYDINPQNKQLVVNDDETAQVQAIFQLYLEHEGMLPVVEELADRGWRNKTWSTRKGHSRGGKLFTRTSLYKLLTNITYAGKVIYKGEVYAGAHKAIIPMEVWVRTQQLLSRNGQNAGAHVRNSVGALLKGLLRCKPCNSAMTYSFSTKDGVKRYHYYVCNSAQKRGWSTCPSKSIPAGEIERFVLNQIRSLGSDPKLARETFSQAQEHLTDELASRHIELESIQRQLAATHAELAEMAGKAAENGNGSTTGRIADLQDRIAGAERRGTEIRNELESLKRQKIIEQDVVEALSQFDSVWEVVRPHERIRVIRLLVERVEYDGEASKVAVTFQPAGINYFKSEFCNGERNYGNGSDD